MSQMLVSCPLCKTLHTPKYDLSLNPVCPRCAAPMRPRAFAPRPPKRP